MKITKNLAVDRSEIFRYLGYRNIEPDENVKALIEECIVELEQVAVPREVHRRVSCTINDKSVILGELVVQSESLAKHLSECKEVLLFAATIGTGVDRLLHRYGKLQVSKEVVMQAAAAAMIEKWCDMCQDEFSYNCSDKIFLKPRFSPGYGDFSLNFQKPLLGYLDAGKRIGLELTDSMLMIPSKSVSAVIGISEDETGCSVHKCERCGNVCCAFRKK